MQISAKDLGWLAVDGFCPRCFWVERHYKLPYQGGFPGIFSSIDSYTKNIVERYFERNGRFPDWFNGVGEAKSITHIKPSEFKTTVGNMTLTGIPDLIFQKSDSSFCIVDYKTARYTANQDELMPVYQIQLNGYAYIAERLGNKPVKELYLVYFEPPHSDRFLELTVKHTTDEGFEMPFRPRVHKISKNTDKIENLLKKANKIYEMETLPKGLDGCNDCERLDKLITLMSSEK